MREARVARKEASLTEARKEASLVPRPAATHAPRCHNCGARIRSMEGAEAATSDAHRPKTAPKRNDCHPTPKTHMLHPTP